MKVKTIFIIDDEEKICNSVQRCLYAEGYNTLGITNPLSAIEEARKNRPELILLDISMPGINGIELCRMIREDKDIQDTPIIMLTAHYEEDYIRSAIESGADDYIIKPFDPSDLKDKIRHVFLLFREGLLPSQLKRHTGTTGRREKKKGEEARVEKRRHKRAATPFPVEYKGNSVWQFKKGANISLGGLFICTERIEAPGTKVFLDFSFPGKGAGFSVEGKVAWARKEPVRDEKGEVIYPAGMGIEFTMVSPEERGRLDRIIEENKES